MVDVTLAQVSGKRIVQAVNLDVSTAKPVQIKAIKDARYVLTEGEKLVAPENITVKRVGSNLWLLLPGTDAEHPQLIIENFYHSPGEIVGLAEDGGWHAFVSANADRAQDPMALEDGEMSPLLLDMQPTTPLDNLSVDSNALSLGMIGLGAAAAVGALAMLASNSGGSKGQDAPLPEEQTPPPEEQTPPAEQSPPAEDDQDLPTGQPPADENGEVELPADHDTPVEEQAAEPEQEPEPEPDQPPPAEDVGTEQPEPERQQPPVEQEQIDIPPKENLFSDSLDGGLLSGAFDTLFSTPDLFAADDTVETLTLEDLLPAGSDLTNWAQVTQSDAPMLDSAISAAPDEMNTLMDELLNNSNSSTGN